MYNPGQVFGILLCLHLLSASDFNMTKNKASLISILAINLRNSKNASMDFGNVLALRSPSSFQSKEPYNLLSKCRVGPTFCGADVGSALHLLEQSSVSNTF